jgi:hypothetical protein
MTKNGYAQAGFRCTVYLPAKLVGLVAHRFSRERCCCLCKMSRNRVSSDGEPEFVQIEVSHDCVARLLIREALTAFRKAPPRHAQLPPNDSKLWDYNAYRLYAAEDDGEIDTDFPALDENCQVDSTGNNLISPLIVSPSIASRVVHCIANTNRCGCICPSIERCTYK